MANTLKLGAGKWATGTDTVLAFNDENNNFKPLPFDFSRASSATVVNQSGLIETVGSGEPRIDFEGNTKGALKLEPTRSNIFDYSSNLNAWSKLNSTVTESNVLSLDGVNNSYAYERTSSSTSYIYRTVSLSNTTDYTLSLFVKSGTSTTFRTDIWDTTQSVQCEIQIDLVTKTVLNFTGTSYKIEDYTNGWMRISVTFTSESNFGTTFNRYFNTDSVGSELYIWGAQLEQGSYATSYIPTSGSAVTRVAESCYQGGLLDKGVLNNTALTLFFNSTLTSDTSNNYLETISLYNDLNNIGLRLETRTNNQLYVQQSGVVSSGDNFNSFSLGVNSVNLKKIAIYLTTTQFKVFADGNQIYSTYNGTYVLNFNNISFRQNNGSVETKIQNKEIKLYNTALTDQELIALTTI